MLNAFHAYSVNVASRMDSTGENWKIQVPEPTANLLRERGYTTVPRGEINVKGKGIMFTYWILGKNESASRLTSPTICPAGMPMAVTPSSSLQRQTSNHSSLAAVVFGIMQATKRNTPSTRKFYESLINFSRIISITLYRHERFLANHFFMLPTILFILFAVVFVLRETAHGFNLFIFFVA